MVESKPAITPRSAKGAPKEAADVPLRSEAPRDSRGRRAADRVGAEGPAVQVVSVCHLFIGLWCVVLGVFLVRSLETALEAELSGGGSQLTRVVTEK